ncbi:hypothetical protein RhiirB3_432088 [Rhizophagus irregularis]|nr:hypothetical protein RhiirB3_432088 [Rhizophagus irregularis]
MSCSKIFPGDFPELTCEVIKYLQNDYSTLYSCVLVNRLWCLLAIPLLWENPISISNPNGNYNFNFIEIYLHNLNDDKLNEYKINDNPLPLNTLFNYPKFLKYLNTYDIFDSVDGWVEGFIRTSKPENRYFLKGLNFHSVTDFKELIIMSLFKLFIENEVNLHTLEIKVTDPNFHTCFYNILDRIIQIINLHQNLKTILLGNGNLLFYRPLLLSKDCNCSNSLNNIILCSVDFNNMNNFKKIFEQLNVLESVHVVHCSSLSDFIQQIITLTKPFKLKSLFINEILQIESIQLLLQKSGDYLENFGYRFDLDYNLSLKKQQLLELITKYCKNIKFLDLYGIDNLIIYPIINLIENVKQNLSYLSISTCNNNPLTWEDYFYSSYGDTECSSIILQNLGQTLPSKLEYLHLSLHHIKTSDFEIFLKNSQDTFIKKLLIYHRESQDILPTVKEYIMKKERVKYLAIGEPFFDASTIIYCNELILWEDEVKEFELYNIKVQSFNSLLIYYVYYFMREFI